MKRCSSCGESKPQTEYRPDRTRSDRLYPYCFPCDKKYRRDYMKEWRQQDKNRAYMKTYWERIGTRVSRLYRAARDRARKKGDVFLLNEDVVRNALEKGVCHRTGLTFDLTMPDELRFNPHAPSIDKINQRLPYSDDNIQLVVDWYNRAKGQHSDADFLAFCRLVVAHADRLDSPPKIDHSEETASDTGDKRGQT